MPSTMPRRPKDGDEEQALEEQDRASLKGDEWQWYPWLYKDALSLLMGGATGPQYPGGSQYSFNYNLEMGPIPDLADTGGDTTIAVSTATWTDEQLADLAKMLSGGGADSIILPACLLTTFPMTDLLAVDKLLDKANNSGGAGDLFDFDFDPETTSPSCPYSGFEIEKACYAGAECKDGVRGILVTKTGQRLTVTVPSIIAYTGGSNPSPFAVNTFSQALDIIWGAVKDSLQANCDCN